MVARQARTPSPSSLTSLEVLSALAVAANRGETLAGALPSILGQLCETGGWDLGHAYRIVPGEERILPLDTWWPAEPVGFEAFRSATADVQIADCGLVRRIRESGGPIWIRDLRSTAWYLRRDGAVAAALRSTLVFPIVGPDRLSGIIELLSREPREQDPVLIELARHAGIVLGQILDPRVVESRFRPLFDLLPVPVGVTTLEEGRFVEVNAALADFCGYSREQMLGATAGDLGIVVEGWDRERRIDELREGGSSLTLETRIRTEATGARDVVATVSIVPWAGAPHLLASVMDLTPLRTAERQIGRSRVRIHQLTARLLQLQEAERGRLSRELHDQLGQRLSALKMILDRLGRGATDPELPARGGEIARQLIERVRGMSFELRPAILDQLGLPTAIRRYVERSADAAGLSTTFDVEDSLPSLSDRATTACFRILQEAVTNVLRHAEARSVHVALRRNNDETVLTVRDDGVGFDRSATGHLYGLMIMEERAEGVGGRVTVSSRIGEGTEVVVRLPADDHGRASSGEAA